MRVTLTVQFITEYKKAESPVNTRIEDPDVSAIIFAPIIIKWFGFNYFIHFTIMESRLLVYVFKIDLFLLFKENTWPSGPRMFFSFSVLSLFCLRTKKHFCNFIKWKRKKHGFTKDFKSNSFVYLKSMALSISILRKRFI